MVPTKIASENMYATYVSLDELKLLDSLRRSPALERAHLFNLVQTVREHNEKDIDATNVVAIRPQKVATRHFRGRTRPTKGESDFLRG